MVDNQFSLDIESDADEEPAMDVRVDEDTGLYEECDRLQIGLLHCSSSNNSNMAVSDKTVHLKMTKIKEHNSRVKPFNADLPLSALKS